MPSFNGTTGSPSGGLYIIVEYTVGQPNVAANTTPVDMTLSLRHGGLSVGAGTDDCKVWIGGQSYSWTGPDIYSSGGTVALGSHHFDVPHNADGTWSGEIGASYRLGINYGGSYVGTISGKQPLTLPTIPRASDFRVGDITIGADNTVTINRASAGFTHTVTLTMGSRSVQVANAGDTATITPPMEWCNGIPNATTASGTMTVDTYSGIAKIGSKSKSVSILVPASVKPTVTASANLVNGFEGLYIQGRSKVRIQSAGAGAYGSTIKSYSVSGAGYAGSRADWTSGVLNVTGDVVFTAVVTDSRGRTASTTVRITVIAYSRPTITVQQLVRCDASGTVTEAGTYALVQATLGFAPVNGLNAVSCNVYYRRRGDSAWNGSAAIISGQGKAVFDGNLAITDEYEIRFYATDSVGEHAESILTIPSSANYLLAAKQGCMGLLRYPDLEKSGVQVGGNLYIDGPIVGGPLLSLNGVSADIVEDFNNYRAPGTYAVRTDDGFAGVQNRPPNAANQAGVLIVRSGTGAGNANPEGAWRYIQQIWLPRSADQQQWARSLVTDASAIWSFGAWEAYPPGDYLPITGGTVNRLWAQYPGSEADVGVYFKDGGRLYLFGNDSTGARGLYDSELGTVISKNTWAGAPIPVDKGGTGADNALNALTNLGCYVKQLYSGSTSGAISFSISGTVFVLVEGTLGGNTARDSVLVYSNGRHQFSDDAQFYSFDFSGSGISAKVAGSGVINRVLAIQFPGRL